MYSVRDTREIRMVTLRGIVDRILSRYGYQPIERDGVIEGELAGNRVNIAIALHAAGVDAAAASLRDRKGALIVACAEDVDQPSKDGLGAAGISVWDRAGLEEEIGAAVVTHLDAEKGGLFAMLAVRQIEAVPKDASLPLLVEEDVPGERILKPTVTADDAKEISSKTIGGYKYELELVPYYFFDYFCILKVSGIESPDKRTGVIGVNALTGEAQPWKALGEVVQDLSEPHIRLEPKIEPADAERGALERVVRLHTEEVERVTEKGHATIIDKMVVAPGHGDVTLTSKGLVYVPMWCVEGLHGVMVLNAALGKVVSEEFYAPDKKQQAEQGRSQ
jgi:hypothetical protein